MKKVNWGIIGLGNIAQSFSEGFYETVNAKLLGISSNNNEKLEYFKDKFKIERKYAFKSYEELLDCKDIDIVYIALPNNLHYEWIIKAIDKNKKILVEKPSVLKLVHAKNIEKKVLEKNIFFSEGYMYRYYPQIKKLVETINSEEMGGLISMETSFGLNLLTKKKFIFFNKRKKIDPNNRLFNKELGGGCILDLGCYPASLSLLVASQSKGADHKKFKITDVRKKIGSTGIDIDSACVLVFEGGFKSKIKASFENNIGNKSIINFEKGTLIMNDTWFGTNGITKIVNGKRSVIENKMTRNIYSYQIEVISKSIMEKKNQTYFPGFTIEDTMLNTEILENWLNE
jgi:predicted dehydrogenase